MRTRKRAHVQPFFDFEVGMKPLSERDENLACYVGFHGWSVE